jgi:O-antigen/teichoic acid export membrane protein
VTGGDYRTRRSALNFATGLFATGATIAVAFVTTPLLLRFLGPERFGAARAASDWFGHLSILELGLGGALAPLLALALGRGDAAGVRDIMAEGMRSFLRVAGLAAATGLLITLFIGRLVPVSPELLNDLRTGCLIGVMGLLLYPLAPFRQLADAGQRGYAVSLIGLAQSLTFTLMAVLLAWKGFGITGQFAAYLAGQLLFFTLITHYGTHRHPGVLAAAIAGPRNAEARAAIRKLNLPSLLFDLSSRAGLLTDNIVIALVLGPAAVVPLFLTQRLTSLAQGQLQSVGGASWAALGQLHALGRHDVFNARLVELTRLVAALATIVLIPIAAYNHIFIGLWIGESNYGGPVVTAFATVNAFLLALVSLWGYCFSGTGQVALLVPAMIAGSVLNVALSVTGALVFGVAGPLMGTCIALAATTLWYLPVLLQRHFGADLGSLVRAVVLPLLWAAAPAAVIVFVAKHYPPASWLALGVQGAASGMLLLSVWWFGELRAEERAHYAGRVRMALPGRKEG